MRIKRKTRKRNGGLSPGGIEGRGSRISLVPVGGAIRIVSDTVGGLIKGAGDGIATMMGSKPDAKPSTKVPDVTPPKELDSTKSPPPDQKGGKRKRRKGNTKRKRVRKNRKLVRSALYQRMRKTLNRMRYNRRRVTKKSKKRSRRRARKRRGTGGKRRSRSK